MDNLHYQEKVEIISGFYKGSKGVIINEFEDSNKLSYDVELATGKVTIQDRKNLKKSSNQRIKNDN